MPSSFLAWRHTLLHIIQRILARNQRPQDSRQKTRSRETQGMHGKICKGYAILEQVSSQLAQLEGH